MYKALSVTSQYKQYYPELSQFAANDPSYLLPIVVMLANYHLLDRSQHPFLVNVR